MIGKLLNKTLEWTLVVLMALMVLDVTWQVFTRFVLRDPSSFTEELATFLLIWIGLLGASYAYKTRSHLGIDILLLKAQGKRRATMEIFIHTIVSLFAIIVMVFGGWKLVSLTYELNQISAAMGISMGTVYLVLPIAGLLIVYYAIEKIIVVLSLLKTSVGRDDPEEWLTKNLSALDPGEGVVE